MRRVTAWGLVTNVLLSALKFAVGSLASSQALVADAVHSLSDTVTDVAVLVGVRYWTAPADAEHPHGHGRIELLVTVGIGVALAAAGLGLGYEAVSSWTESRDPPIGLPVLGAAVASMVAKELLYRWTVRVGRRVSSSALQANAWHHRTDALSSVPVALAAIATLLWPGADALDLVAAVVVGAFIVRAAWQIVWPAVQKLADAGADDRARERILAIAMETGGVLGAHKLRTRHIGTGLQVDLHLLVDPAITVREGHDIAHAVERQLLSAGPNVQNVLLHVEPVDDDPEQ